MNTYYVYILTTIFNKLLYIGVTNNLERRIFEHKNKLIDGFTKKYNISKLVYYEEYGDVKDAISREKQLKGRLRSKKMTLISNSNKDRKDLASDGK